MLAQRVSRTFRDGIIASPTIQTALFLRPSHNFTVALFGPTLARVVHCTNDSDCRIFAYGLAEPTSNGSVRMACDASDKICHNVKFNPFAVDDYRNAIYLPQTTPHDDASWTKMSLMQPPVREIIVDHGNARHWHTVHASEASRGVTLGDLQQSVKAFNAAVAFQPYMHLGMDYSMLQEGCPLASDDTHREGSYQQ